MDRWIYFDLDDTLILWDTNKYKNLKTIRVQDPWDKETIHRFKRHRVHINWLKRMKARGETIIVWSAGGVRWASAVIGALGLTDYVDYILQKPDTIYDDEDPKYWMPMCPRWKPPG